MKKVLKTAATILLVIALLVVIYLIINFYLSHKSTVIIEKYKTNADVKLKTIHITEQDEIEKVDSFVKQLKPLEDDEMINIVVTEDIVVTYKDKISIIVMEDRKGICAYTLANSQVTHLSFMPEGMYEWVMGKLK